MKKISRHIILIFFLISISYGSFAQKQVITVHANNEKLSDVLKKLTQEYDIKFAFDADFFSSINITINQDKIPLSQFLDKICTQHWLLYDLIEETFVLYKNPNPPPPPKPEYIKLTGQVIDKTSGEPLLFCNIGLGENKGTITNELGIFNIKLIKEDEIKVQISHLGYQRLDTIINTTKIQFHTIALVPFAIHIEEIEVRMQEKNVIEISAQPDQIAFNPKQSENIPKVDDSDLTSALCLIPGINFQGGQISGISIRGGSPSENQILLDGMPILETSHLFGNLSVLNSKYISQAFVSRGAFDASYGERVSGIIELKGKDNYYRPSLDLSANLLNVNAAATVPIGKVVSISGAYRKSYLDQWENYLYQQILEQGTTNENESSIMSKVLFDDLNMKISIKPDDKQNITFSAFQSLDEQQRDFIFNTNSRFYQNDGADSKNQGLGANWKYQNKNWEHKINLGYNKLLRGSYSVSGLEANKQGRGGKEESDIDDNQLNELIANFSASLKTGIFTHELGVGANIDEVSYLYKNDQTNGNVKVDSINYDSQLTVLHAFFQEKIKLNEQINFRLGLRVNHEDLNNQFYFQPRWGVQIKLTDDIGLFYSGGIYNQFMSKIRKIDSDENSDLVWFLPESTGTGILTAQQHTLGIQYEKDGLAINVEPYYKAIDGKVNLYAEMSGKGNVKTIKYVPREGASKHYGIDALIHYKQGKFMHMLAYSLSKSMERFESFNNNDYYPSFDDQLHRIRWTEMFRYNSWIASSNLTYHTGSPYLISEGTESVSQEFGQLPYFAQLDFSLMKRFKYKFFHFNAGISLLNILNRENVLEVDYFNISDTTGSYSVRTDVTAMKFTPTFFVNIKLQ